MSKSIGWHYDKAHKLACKKVEQMARTILRNHPNLNEFVMAMGTASFSVKDAGYDIRTDEKSYMKSLDNFINKWDMHLKLTGTPMRFTAKGKKRTAW